MDGLWEVTVPVEALGDAEAGRSGVFTRGQPVQLQTEVQYEVNNRTSPQDSLTQQGNDENDFDARDTRSVIMTSESGPSGQ
jgi:hypothetical protein